MGKDERMTRMNTTMYISTDAYNKQKHKQVNINAKLKPCLPFFLLIASSLPSSSSPFLSSKNLPLRAQQHHRDGIQHMKI